MNQFTGPSGANIIIQAAPWPDAKKLKMAVEREAAGAGINLLDLKSDASGIVSAILRVDGADAVDAALWPCLARCLRGGQKITEQTFDDPEARKDYYEIVIECMKVNFGPLVESLASKLPFLQAKPSETTPTSP
ncbi:MAG: hypothetical protein LAP61_05635 [Acidobacteriia bacterium]|nr:hypothetical protein [Terriglobia bacterium]